MNTPTATLAPAVFVGVQEGFEQIPSIELYNLTTDIAGHSNGSTVSRDTIERAGFYLPPLSVRERRREAWYLRNHAA